MPSPTPGGVCGDLSRTDVRSRRETTPEGNCDTMILDMIDQARRRLHLDALEGTICRGCAAQKGMDQGDVLAPSTDPEVLQAVDAWLRVGGLSYPRYEHGHACEQPGCTARFVDCPDVGESGYCNRLDTPIVCPAHDCRDYEPADIPADFKFRYADFGEYIVDGVRVDRRP